MSGSTPPVMQGVVQAMRHLSDRQRVISQNIANADTPGYRAREMQPEDFSSLLAATGGGKTGPRVGRPHVPLTAGMVALGASPQRDPRVMLDRDITETKPDGNNVTLEDQLLHMGQTQADFTALTGLYRKQMGLLRSAIGRGGG